MRQFNVVVLGGKTVELQAYPSLLTLHKLEALESLH